MATRNDFINARERAPLLTGDPEHDIKELNRVIALGGNVDGYKSALRLYLSYNIITEPLIDLDLQNVPEAVVKRIKALDSYLQIPELEVDIVNIEAVRKAYLDGLLEIRPGYWTYWVGGRQKSGYVNSPMAIGPAPHEVFLQWVKEENGYRVWMEHPGNPFQQLAAYEYQPTDQHEHHSYWVLLKVPGADDNTILIPVLDDTGSTYLEIFETDRAALRIFPALLQIHPPVVLTTAAAPVYRNVIALTAKLLDRSYSGIGDWCHGRNAMSQS